MTDPTPTAEHVEITRIFAASREAVFKAWTDPDELAAWYGPAHMDAPLDRIRIDLREGGRWELTMVQAGGGGGFSIGYDILEVLPPELLVMRSDPMPDMGMPDPVIVRIELQEVDGGTRMMLTDGPYPTGSQHAEAGWVAAFDKLTALLAATSA